MSLLAKALPVSQPNGSASSYPSKLGATPRKKAEKELEPEPVVESEPEEDSENISMGDGAARGSGSESEVEGDQFEGAGADNDLVAGDMPGATSMSLPPSGAIPQKFSDLNLSEKTMKAIEDINSIT